MGTDHRQKATFLSSISKCVYIRAGNPLTPLDCDAIVWYLRENQVYIRQTKEAMGDIFFLQRVTMFIVVISYFSQSSLSSILSRKYYHCR